MNFNDDNRSAAGLLASCGGVIVAFAVTMVGFLSVFMVDASAQPAHHQTIQAKHETCCCPKAC